MEIMHSQLSWVRSHFGRLTKTTGLFAIHKQKPGAAHRVGKLMGSSWGSFLDSGDSLGNRVASSIEQDSRLEGFGLHLTELRDQAKLDPVGADL